MGKVIAILALVALLALAGLYAAFWWQDHAAARLAVKAQQQAGTAVVSAGQAQAATQALRITVAGEARDRATASIQAENEHAILQAPGAGATLDPGLVDRLRAGLCHYDAYRADPGCAGLRQPDPGELQEAGPAGEPPG